jgi:hypothetical protein
VEAELHNHLAEVNNMTTKFFYLTPLLLIAACARNNNTSPVVSAEPAPAEPTPAASAPAPASEAEAPVTEVAQRTSDDVLIPSGAILRVRLDETVDTRRNAPGDAVHATLSQPVVVGGRTILPVGTQFTGHVTTADASGRLKGRAHIGVALDSFQHGGRTHRISTTSVDRASAAHKKRNGVLIGGGAGLGAALGALAGGGKGALIGAGAGAAAGTAGAAATGKLHVAIPAETPLRFTLRAPVR